VPLGIAIAVPFTSLSALRFAIARPHVRALFFPGSADSRNLMKFPPEAHLLKATRSLRRLCAFFVPVAALALCPAAVLAQTAWPTYDNARFQYSICYPQQRLVPQPEAENGDGRHFRATDGAELTVYGDNDTTKETPEAAADEIGTRLGAPPDGRVTYKVVHGDWFVVSGRTMKQIFFA
jgi:hypothetical protein